MGLSGHVPAARRHITSLEDRKRDKDRKRDRSNYRITEDRKRDGSNYRITDELDLSRFSCPPLVPEEDWPMLSSRDYSGIEKDPLPVDRESLPQLRT